MSRLIDADALKRKAQRVATESWKMRLTARIETTLNQFIDWIDNAPTVQPEPSEITDERAILHLQSTGWMQNHDREIYESGLKERLADDSESYDSLIPYEDDGDTISRQAALDALMSLLKQHECDPMPDLLHWTGVKAILEMLPSVHTESQWIPVGEGLPEDDTDVLISYRYKDGEGDTSHVYIDTTSYGDIYFGGNAVHDLYGNKIKHWRPPFAYFESNYYVIAWMPLPEPPYKEGQG